MQNHGNEPGEFHIVGCGPSLINFDWESLRGKATIAVNGSLAHVPDPHYFVTADSKFARRIVKERFWGKFGCCRVLVMAENHKMFPFIQHSTMYWDRIIHPTRFDGRIGFKDSDFATGQNSGFCDMQFAVLLGAKRIHLYGIDCTAEGRSNYHGFYQSGTGHFPEYRQHFVTAISILHEAGIEVVSHSAISSLNEHIQKLKPVVLAREE